MAAKGRKNSKKVVQKVVEPEPEPESSDEEEADLETMERMLDSDSEGTSEEDVSNNQEEEEASSEEDGEDESEVEDESSEDEGEDEDVVMGGDEKCNIDLRNLVAFNTHQMNHKALFQKQSKVDNGETTILVDGIMIADEGHLMEKASEGCTQLLADLWKLDSEKTDAGPLAILPSYFTTVTPRALPPPPQKVDTKWEKFAKERGIAPKEKRSRKVWDDTVGEWAHRTGYQKASSPNDPMSWPIMEVKRNDDPFDDPWEKARDAKKDRVDKNTMNKMKNAEIAGDLDRGTTRRIMKTKQSDRESGRAGGRLDSKNFSDIPAGVPMDMAEKQRGKDKTKLALLATQRSTASMGKFDQMRQGEPERRKAMAGLKKRKFESGTSKDGIKTEAKKSMRVLQNVITGGGRAKELAIRRGEHARGETGHDYDFNDGLGSSKFKKKKGRAGIGKMSKVTKKMSK